MVPNTALMQLFQRGAAEPGAAVLPSEEVAENTDFLTALAGVLDGRGADLESLFQRPGAGLGVPAAAPGGEPAGNALPAAGHALPLLPVSAAPVAANPASAPGLPLPIDVPAGFVAAQALGVSPGAPAPQPGVENAAPGFLQVALRGAPGVEVPVQHAAHAAIVREAVTTAAPPTLPALPALPATPGAPDTSLYALHEAMSTELEVAGAASQPLQPTVRGLPAFTVSVQREGWQPQVGERVAWMANNGMQRAELQLDPPSLGRVDVTVVMKGEHAQVMFNADTSAGREVLESSMPRLRDALAENGITLADVNVSERDSRSQQEHGARAGDQTQPEPALDDAPVVRHVPRGLLDTFA